jgi:heterodisulfide reductase subunit B
LFAEGLGRAYEESLLPVMKHLGVELQELDDWNCCGATAYMAVDEVKACVLAARNLAWRRSKVIVPSWPRAPPATWC